MSTPYLALSPRFDAHVSRKTCNFSASCSSDLNAIFMIVCRPVGMTRTLNIQTGGSLAVVGTFAASEWAARLLDAHPDSSAAWRLNFGLFRAFENARLDSLPLRFLFGPASLHIAIAILVMILGVRIIRSRFAVALFANFSFFGAVMLAYETPGRVNAVSSLSVATLERHSDIVLVGGLLAASFIAFAASHFSFVSAIRNANARPIPREPVAAGQASWRLGIAERSQSARSPSRAPNDENAMVVCR